MSCREMMRRKEAGWLVSNTDHSWSSTLTANLQKCSYCGEYRDTRSSAQRSKERDNTEWNGWPWNSTRSRPKGWWRDEED